MVVALIVALSVLAGRTGATDTYYTTYDNVTGIKYGTAVLYEGYQIGQVDTVDPTDAKGGGGGKALLFKVTMKVRKGWRIPEDSVARAAVSGLLSAMTIDIRGGKSEKLVPPGGEVKGVSSSNFFATLSELGSQFGDLSNDSIKPLMQSLNSLVQRLDHATQDSLPLILKDIQTLTGALAKQTPEIMASVKHSSQIIENDILSPENRLHIDQALAGLDQTSQNMARFSADLGKTSKAINEATATVNRIMNDNAGNIDESLRDLRYTLDTASRYIDEIAQNAAVTSRNMAEFSRSIRDNPGLFLRGSPQPDDAKAQTK
jgi:phospholipid/cholesterol/gamma-HCH transport system substrate-binding protein